VLRPACGSDVESVFARDDLLTWITAYWLTGTIGTSFGPYIEPARPPARIRTPVFMSVFPRDIPPAPRVFAERFLDIAGWREHAAGGHFAAWERPREYAIDLLDAACSLSSSPDSPMGPSWSRKG
jgi:hypothetical protein